jgi:hypothetical protein
LTSRTGANQASATSTTSARHHQPVDDRGRGPAEARDHQGQDERLDVGQDEPEMVPPGTADLGRQAWEMMLPKLESRLGG